MIVDPTEHIEAFNGAVATGAWDAFVGRFAPDATMAFAGPPVGPFAGRAAIAEAYTSNPPDDTITLHAPPYRDGDELVVPYRWSTTGATGTMRFTERDGLIERLVVTFD